MTAPIDLAAYRRVQRFVERFDPGGDPEALTERTRAWWDALQHARDQYRTRREARGAVGWPYDR